MWNKTVLNWVKGELIGPMQADDLALIGKTIDDEYIVENSEKMIREISKIRTHHKHFGRKLKKIIYEIISYSGVNSLNLSEDEYEKYTNTLTTEFMRLLGLMNLILI